LLFEIAPDQGKKETFLRSLAKRSFEADDKVIELVARRKDDSLFHCDVAVSPARLADSTIFVAIVRDATERRRMEQMKSEFVSTVSHELRTPLTSIAGALGLIQGGAVGQFPEKAARLIDIAHGNSQRLIRLINDILDMEKLEAGRMDFRLRSVRLADFLEQAVQSNAGYAEQYSVTLELELPTADTTVVADPDLLMQIMANLISNAAKFSHPGGAVRIFTAPLDRRWRISVEDCGTGIPDAFKSRIFGKFAQAEASDSRQKGGTGLGLSIVREIVTRMGGEVSFETVLGQGTTFNVDIPADRRQSERGELCASHLPHVLHIEDDPDVLAVVADALGGRYQVSAAQTLAAARTMISQTEYDMVILDLALPDGNSRDLIADLRRSKSQILVFTAQDLAPEITQHVDAMLIKSRSSLEDLVATLDQLLGEKSITAEGVGA
jgi:signal transduction histidine kinase/CheY-like chemotaxis protein